MGATSLENVTCGGAAASAAITNSDSTTIKANTLTRSARHPSNVGFVMTGSFRLFISVLIINSPDQTTYINRASPKPAPVFGRSAASQDPLPGLSEHRDQVPISQRRSVSGRAASEVFADRLSCLRQCRRKAASFLPTSDFRSTPFYSDRG